MTATVGANNVATVSWQAGGNATSASINGTAVALSGSTTVTISAQTTFLLTARNATGQTATASATVSTIPSPTAQISSTLGANNLATLTWQTTNATSVTIDGGPAALSGTATITVNVQTSFTIVAKNAAGQTATAVTVVTPTAR